MFILSLFFLLNQLFQVHIGQNSLINIRSKYNIKYFTLSILFEFYFVLFVKRYEQRKSINFQNEVR